MLSIVSNSAVGYARSTLLQASAAVSMLVASSSEHFRHSVDMLIRHFGALAFFPLGMLDMSIIPLPGGFDILLIAITAAHPDLWWYYALMAAGGSVFGAWFTFQLARRGGEELLLRRIGRVRTRKLFTAYRRWGLWFLFAGAIAPPPMPASTVVLAAGALRYPRQNFLISWSLARLLRFGLIAWITMRFGRNIFHWIRGQYAPILWALAALSVAALAAAGLWHLLRKRRAARREK